MSRSKGKEEYVMAVSSQKQRFATFSQKNFKPWKEDINQKIVQAILGLNGRGGFIKWPLRPIIIQRMEKLLRTI